jgi:putative hydrolase of the HAD superfamily
MKVVAFDLGDTLVEYEGLPLSWEAHYREALANLALFLGVGPDTRHIDQGCAVLRRYNTRINPREAEVSFASILDELLRAFACDAKVDELPCATAFFRIFRQKLRCFPDTAHALAKIRKSGMKIGVFTDVPYGMPRELVIEDVGATVIVEFVDALITSRDVGFRKPSPATLKSLAAALSCELHEMVYVGNEKKDIEVARACGCHSILIDRAKHGCDWGQDRMIASLSEI